MDHTQNRLINAAARAAAAGARVAAESAAAQRELAEALCELETVLRSPTSPATLRAAYFDAVDRLHDAERRRRLVQGAADRRRQERRGRIK